MAKLLPFVRKPAVQDAALDVCLAKGDVRRHYLIVERSRATWECVVEEDGRVNREEMSRAEAVRRKAELELRIATELGAGWTLERNR